MADISRASVVISRCDFQDCCAKVFLKFFFEPGRLTRWFLSSTQQKVLPLPQRQWYVLMGCYGAMGSYGYHMVSSCKKYNFERKVTKWLFLLVFPPTNFYFSSCSWKHMEALLLSLKLSLK